MKVKQESWLDKKEWRETHDIFRVQGFNWLANHKGSRSIKLAEIQKP
ncbi:MAG TPA: hypothetical protein VLA68_06000 [Nitrososphaera sp.]|nr:hypothetical protein [Nitrososphaera sp.]